MTRASSLAQTITLEGGETDVARKRAKLGVVYAVKSGKG